MVFSSLSFLIVFLPVTAGVYYLCPKRFRNLWLFLSSIVFYGYGEPRFLPVFLFSIVWNHVFGLLIEKQKQPDRKRLVLLICLLGDIGTLAVFKYTDFACGLLGLAKPGIPLPIGISFFTFQEISYAVDIYRGTPAQKDPVCTGLYIAFFPQLIAGPILRYDNMRVQIGSRKETAYAFSEGFFRFCRGLCRKVLLANRLGLMSDHLLSGQGLVQNSAPALLVGVFAFGIQLYLDFSGYSDMAIGLGQTFGFRIPENFRDPYLAENASDFWRRWHISLSGWFRDYVYIPLGGSRRGHVRTIMNLLIVWFLTGLWHGADIPCVLWGLLWGVWIIAERFLIRPAERGSVLRTFYRCLTFVLAVFLFVLLKVNTFSELCLLWGRIFSLSGWTDLQMPVLKLWLHDEWFWILMALAVSFGLFRRLYDALYRRNAAFAELIRTGILLGGFVLSVSFIAGSSYNPFLYFQF